MVLLPPALLPAADLLVGVTCSTVLAVDRFEPAVSGRTEVEEALVAAVASFVEDDTLAPGSAEVGVATGSAMEVTVGIVAAGADPPPAAALVARPAFVGDFCFIRSASCCRLNSFMAAFVRNGCCCESLAVWSVLSLSVLSLSE